MSQQHEIIVEAQRWIEKAENDFRNAEYVLTMPEKCPFDTVTYHCHQCVEKYLKAVLTFRSISFPKTHDLVVLLNRLTEKEEIKILIQRIQPLNRYSIEARYPGDWEPIDAEEARSAFETAKSVRNTLRTLMEKVLE